MNSTPLALFELPTPRMLPSVRQASSISPAVVGHSASSNIASYSAARILLNSLPLLIARLALALIPFLAPCFGGMPGCHRNWLVSGCAP